MKNAHGRRWTAQEAAGAAFGFKTPSTQGGFQAKSQDRLKAERDQLVIAMLTQLSYVGLNGLFQREYKFHVERRWRLDLYSAKHRLGVELHGGIYAGGRHTRGGGFTADREKMNAAIELGICVLEYTPKEIADGSALAQIERMIKQSR